MATTNPLTPLAKRLKKLRKRAKLSCRQLSRLAGKSHAFVSQIERMAPSSERQIASTGLEGLAAVFGASLDWLCLGKGEAPDDATLRASVARAAEVASRSKTGGPNRMSKRSHTAKMTSAAKACKHSGEDSRA